MSQDSDNLDSRIDLYSNFQSEEEWCFEDFIINNVVVVKYAILAFTLSLNKCNV